MNQFHLAPWRPYKGILIAAALLALWWIDRRAEEKGIRNMGRISTVYFAAWFLVLFGDGTSGVVFTSSLRSYFVMIGIGLFVWCLVILQRLFV